VISHLRCSTLICSLHSPTHTNPCYSKPHSAVANRTHSAYSPLVTRAVGSLSLSLLFFSLLSLKVPYRGTSVVDRGPLLASVLLQSPHPLTCSSLSEEKCGFGPLTPLRVATCLSTKILLAEVTKK